MRLPCTSATGSLGSCFLLCLALAVPVAAFAQPKDSSRISGMYFGFNGNFGRTFGLGVITGVTFNKHHELSLSWDAYFRESDRYPADYECNSCKHGLDRDWINGFTLHYGYVLYPRVLPGNLRFILQGGVLAGWQYMPRDFVRVANPGPHEHNYKYNDASWPVAALVLTPTAQLALARNCAVSIAPYGVFSKHFSGLGIAAGLRLGGMANSSLRAALRQKRNASGY